MFFQHIILAVLWLLFCFLHTILAVDKIKLWFASYIRFVPYRILYNVFAFLTLTAILIYQYRMKSFVLFKSNTFLLFSGTLLAAIGLVIMIICIIKYFRQLSGLQDSYTDKLQVTGIHKYVRHPLYAGTFAFITGLFLLFPYLHNLLSVIIIISYTLYGIRLEEKKLIKHFGDQYLEYKKSVPALIPFTRRW